MRAYRLLFFLGLASLSCGCHSSDPCVERISHGPWEVIGKRPPDQSFVAAEFEKGGLPRLTEVLGAPFHESPERVVWLFEARSVSDRRRCPPNVSSKIYDQSFTLVSVALDPLTQECSYEIKEVLSEKPIVIKDIAGIPVVALGVPSVSCGTMKVK